MKYLFVTLVLIFISGDSFSQKEKYISVAVYNTQNAMPFGKFAGMFSEILHPGVEFGYGKILSQKGSHEWFGDLKLSYFYHRFVQNGIPLYADIGYRHKIYKQLSAETSLGAGYMHSIPATGKFKLNSGGEYENNKGIGRAQTTANFAIGLNYAINNKKSRPIRIFTLYEIRVQFPFVRSYVPLLPYNSFMIGVNKPLKNISSSKK